MEILNGARKIPVCKYDKNCDVRIQGKKSPIFDENATFSIFDKNVIFSIFK